MVKFIKSLVLYIRCKWARQEAILRAVTTGKKQLVLMYDGKPLVISKQRLKRKIKEGFFSKGFTSEKADSIAIFITQ